MDLSRYKIQELDSSHVDDVTSLWRSSMCDALGIPPVHPFESQAYFLEHILPQNYKVVVVISIDGLMPVGFMASSEDEISQLYVSPKFQGQGIGSYLLNLAKQCSNGSLVLRTFEVNAKAQSFYKQHGFTFQIGSSDNEEGLRDLVCKWQG
ncbi:TPA: GNAT family N-acetyltransferase [Vibrio diabolicus]